MRIYSLSNLLHAFFSLSLKVFIEEQKEMNLINISTCSWSPSSSPSRSISLFHIIICLEIQVCDMDK